MSRIIKAHTLAAMQLQTGFSCAGRRSDCNKGRRASLRRIQACTRARLCPTSLPVWQKVLYNSGPCNNSSNNDGKSNCERGARRKDKPLPEMQTPEWDKAIFWGSNHTQRQPCCAVGSSFGCGRDIKLIGAMLAEAV